MELLREGMREWYFFLSWTSAALSAPAKEIAEWAQIPLLTVFLLGLVGSLSPCQLTTNLSAMAYVARGLGEGGAWKRSLAYTSGKILVYTLVGGAVIFLGLKLDQAAIPVVVAARRAIGPLMIIIGLGLMGAIRLRGSLGTRFGPWLHSRLPSGDGVGAFSLGVVYSFTSCPTLFWLFFGLMIPLALTTPGGSAFPGFFAVGTVLPLLAFTSLLAFGSEASNTLIERLKRSQWMITRIAGAVFILAGINDTLTYWLI